MRHRTHLYQQGPLVRIPEGFNDMSGDWRYTQIMPDGSFLGVTQGENVEEVAFCVGCHLVVKHQDSLYSVPTEHRARQPLSAP